MDLTRISNQPPLSLLASTPSRAAVGNGGDDMALRQLSGAADAAELSGPGLSNVKLDGLRGTSQAFDVAISPVGMQTDASNVAGPNAELGYHPTTVWPTPMLPRLRSDGGGSPEASTLRDGALPGEGKTTFVPPQAQEVDSDGSNMRMAMVEHRTDSPPLAQVTASASDAKLRAGTAHDKVFAHITDFLHHLSTAARLSDRRVDVAIVAVALAALPYRRFRKHRDSVI